MNEVPVLFCSALTALALHRSLHKEEEECLRTLPRSVPWAALSRQKRGMDHDALAQNAQKALGARDASTSTDMHTHKEGA